MYNNYKLRVLLIVLILVTNLVVVYSQDQDDTDRAAIPKQYLEKLPQKLRKTRKKSNNKPHDVNYKLVEGDQAIIDVGKIVGFTFWRLEPSQSSDDSSVVERIAERDETSSSGKSIRSLIPKRVASNEEFVDGDKIRFTIDSLVTGYIYILNREQYIDNSYSDPYLIFPSKIDTGKSDRTIAGKLLFIPDEEGTFTLKRYVKDRPAKVAEVFTILISPEKILDLPELETNKARKLSKELFDRLIKDYGSKTWRFEQEGSSGQAITKAEKSASLNSGQDLPEDGQLPQTVYHINAKPNSPLLFSVIAKIRQ